MRTLILADNGLERIQLSTDDDGGSIAEEDESEEAVRIIIKLLYGWLKLIFLVGSNKPKYFDWQIQNDVPQFEHA